MKQRTIHLAATGARIATGAAVATACVLGVAASVAAPWPVLQSTPASTTVTPMPGDSTIVCNGSFRALGRDSSRADLLVSAGVPRLRLDAGDHQTSTAPLQMPDVLGGEGAQSITGAVSDRTAPLISASESLTLDDEDLRGFAAAPCREATMRSWLVGGDGSTGSSDVIVLSNPADVPATVDLNVYGSQKASTVRIVQPKTQMTLSLASVAGSEPRPVIEVIASGAPVRAAMQSAHVRTLDAVGIDVQDGTGGAQESLRLLGVQSQPITEGDDSTGILLRILAPADDATATVRVRGAAGAAGSDEYTVELTSGVPAEISLTGIPAGAQDVEIDATAPIVAAARQAVRAEGREDFSWMLPAPQLSGTVPFTVPAGAAATLYLRNTGFDPVSVTLEGPSGQTIELPADGVETVSLRAGGHRLRTEGAVHAAVGLLGDGAIAGWPLWSPPATQKPIVVRP
ncbi:DUF5719 family protein [Microbacterium esteraromaticum]|uniref:DUF5719 family protein n=1 Tax=Microbacterium esteraromaticum TaxID=57043 RepID=UPI00195DB75C|nr:DUF5719 family protein [Microbacterium esteraromaticum]MBM7467128.1 hypothetical protein [Microbacterium esteraromaticum]